MKQEPGNASSQESPGFSRGEEVNRALIVSEAPRAVAISRDGEETVWSARTRRWHGPGGRPDIESDDAVYGPWDLVYVAAPDDNN